MSEHRCCICTKQTESEEDGVNTIHIENAKKWLPIDTRHLTSKDDDTVYYYLCTNHQDRVFPKTPDRSSISPKELRYKHLLQKYAKKGW